MLFVASEQVEAIESTTITFVTVARPCWSSVSVRGDLSSGADQLLLPVYRIIRRGGYCKERVHARRFASVFCVGEPTHRHSIADVAFLCRPRRMAAVQRQSVAVTRTKDEVPARSNAKSWNVESTSSISMFRGLDRSRTHSHPCLDRCQTFFQSLEGCGQFVYLLSKAKDRPWLMLECQLHVAVEVAVRLHPGRCLML